MNPTIVRRNGERPSGLRNVRREHISHRPLSYIPTTLRTSWPMERIQN